MRRIILSFLFPFMAIYGATAQDDAMYVYRNDGVINAFLKEEIDSIRHSPLDLDSVMHAENVTQEVWTVDSVFRIPLEAIDSVSFITPPTVYKNDVTKLEDNLLDYVIGADGLTLKLMADTPAMILPAPGDKLVLLEGCDVLPYGFAGIVIRVEVGSSAINIICWQVNIEDLFDSYCNVSTIYGGNPDSVNVCHVVTSDGRRRVIYNPDDGVFNMGPYKYSRSAEISQYLAPGSDLALKGGTSFTVEMQPTFRIHTLLILGEGQGTYFSCRISGSLDISTEESIYGGIEYSKEFLNPVIDFPIAMTGGLVKFYINPGFFFRANATITSSITTSHNYTFGMAFDYSSKGKNSVKPSLGGRLANSSTDMTGSIDGSLAAGAYFETGFNLLCREIARVCVRGEYGWQVNGSFVLRNSDIDNAENGTALYERLKASDIEASTFVNASLQASVGNTGAGISWEEAEVIHKWNLVPTFSDLQQSKGSQDESVVITTKPSEELLVPVAIGLSLHEKSSHIEVRRHYNSETYMSEHRWTQNNLSYEFKGLNPLKKYECYPMVRLWGMELRANPSKDVRFDIDVITGGVEEVDSVSATVYGQVLGIETLTDCTYGICYRSSNQEEWIYEYCTTGSNIFSLRLTDLTENERYYYRAFLQMDDETSYGETKTFRACIWTHLNVDVVMCIDCTGSMSSVISTIQHNAMSFYDLFSVACEQKDVDLVSLTAQVIGFRDLRNDEPMQTSAIYSLPSQKADFNGFVSGLRAEGGGDAPESALEALSSVFSKEDWRGSDDKYRQVVILWTDAPYLTTMSVSSLLTKWNSMPNGKRLILFAPSGTGGISNAGSWSAFDDWPNTIRYTNLEETFTDFEYIMDVVSGELNKIRRKVTTIDDMEEIIFTPN